MRFFPFKENRNDFQKYDPLRHWMFKRLYYKMFFDLPFETKTES